VTNVKYEYFGKLFLFAAPSGGGIFLRMSFNDLYLITFMNINYPVSNIYVLRSWILHESEYILKGSLQYVEKV